MPLTSRLSFCLCTLIAVLLLQGCGSTYSEGVTDSVTINSEPSGATVYVGTRMVGKTPVTVELGKKIAHDVRIELDGYETFKTQLLPEKGQDRHIEFAPIRDSGTFNKLTPNPLNAQLKPERNFYTPSTYKRPAPQPTVSKPTAAPTANAYEEMMILIQANDDALKRGEITKEQHKRTSAYILKLYGY